MYDMAKRSLAFTVATGGLLLTGTGYVPADAAVAFGTSSGPAQAQGSAAANQASPTTVSTPISVSVRGPERAAPAPAAVAPKKDVRVLTPAQPRTVGSGAGAAATSTVKNSGGILSGNTVQIPIYLGLNLCTNQADGAAVDNSVAGSTCGGSGERFFQAGSFGSAGGGLTMGLRISIFFSTAGASGSFVLACTEGGVSSSPSRMIDESETTIGFDGSARAL